MGKEVKSIKSIRKMRKKEAKIVEGPKNTMLIRGNKTSESVMNFMKDIRCLRKERSVLFSRKHETLPFEDRKDIEAYCAKSDTSLFLFGSHNKKRPNNVVFGRTFDNKVLDMVEFGLSNYHSINEISSIVNVPHQVRPFIVFQGDLWETDETYSKIRNLLTDFFFENNKVAGIEVDKILQIVVSFSVLENKRIIMKVYQGKVEGANILEDDGKIVIEELGPNAELILRRHSFADPDLWKLSTHVPKPKKKKENKNIKYDELGNKKGKLYVDRQDLKRVHSKKRKLIRKEVSKRAVKSEATGLKQKNENQFGA